MKHFRAWQRSEITARLESGYSKKEISDYLHEHSSNITREIQRNGYSRYWVYRAKSAQERAEHRWRCRKFPRRVKDDGRVKVDELLKKDYSPEQIAGECRRLGIKMVLHEIIYQYFWWDKAHGSDLYKHLRHRRRYKKRGGSRKRCGTI